MSKDSKLIGLVAADEKSSKQVMVVLKEAIAHARKNDMQAVFIVMVPTDPDVSTFMKAATPLTAEDIDALLEVIEEGHEVVYQLGN